MVMGMPKRVLSTATVAALTLLGDSLLYVVLPLEAAALGLSGLQVGVLLSANRFVRLFTNSGASWLMRRFPPGPPFAAATVLAALTTAAYTLTPAFLPFVIARFLWGLVFSTVRLGCFVTVLAVAGDSSRGRLMGLYRSISRCGSLTAVLAGGYLYDAYGYHAAMLAMATGTLLALPLALWGGPVAERAVLAPALPPGRAQRTPKQGLRRGLLADWFGSARLLAVNWCAFSLSFVARGVVTATLSLFLARAFGDRFGSLGVATVASWLIGVRWLTEIGLATPLGALSDRIGRARSAAGWTLAATAAILALALAPTIGVAVLAAVLLFIAASGLGSTLDAAAGDLAPPERRAQVMSAYADWSDIGAALGPLLALTFADSLGLRPVYALGAILMASGAAAVAITYRRATA